MQPTAITTIFYIFSVVIPIQSRETTYTYNYDYGFSGIFPQFDGVNDFHVYKYEHIEIIFDEKYNGTNIGGAFLVRGHSDTGTIEFEGYLVDISATFYCGGTDAEEGGASLLIDVYYPDGEDDYIFICQEKGWHYNHTWIPPRGTKYQNFRLWIEALDATIDKAYGFDELRITFTDKPPQLLQRDNTSSNNP